MPYYLEQLDDEFVLFEGFDEVARFTRDNFRESLSSLGWSSQKIGCVLRRLNQQFPLPYTGPKATKLDNYHKDHLADYLRSKGYAVYQTIRDDIDDVMIIDHLEKQGYIVEGNGYSSASRLISIN